MTRKLMVAAMAAVWWAGACTEQSPERYPAPSFGQVEVTLYDFNASVECDVVHFDDLFIYGFAVSGSGYTGPQRVTVRPDGQRLKADITGLAPSSDYSISAFATNGINEVFSEEKRFSTGELEEKQYVDLPDPVFKELILRDYDADGDGYLSVVEASHIIRLNICTDDVGSLEGIEFFTKLEQLICCGSGHDDGFRTGGLTDLDLRANINLRSVDVSGNVLSTLLLPESDSNIKEIKCHLNLLDNLELTGCPRLKTLYCYDNHLTSLDLSGNQLLTDLRCGRNYFSDGLDVAANIELECFYCEEDNLRTIDVSSNTELKELNCSDNKIKELDVSNNTNLKVLRAENTLISSIDLSSLPDLSVIYLNNDEIPRIDFSANGQLTDIMLNFTHLLELPDLSHCKHLTLLHLCGYGARLMDNPAYFNSWPTLKAVNFCQYQLDSIDLSELTVLEQVWAMDMPALKVLDLSRSPYLKGIYLQRTPALKTVYVHDSIDIDALTIEREESDTFVVKHKKQ